MDRFNIGGDDNAVRGAPRHSSCHGGMEKLAWPRRVAKRELRSSHRVFLRPLTPSVRPGAQVDDVGSILSDIRAQYDDVRYESERKEKELNRIRNLIRQADSANGNKQDEVPQSWSAIAMLGPLPFMPTATPESSNAKPIQLPTLEATSSEALLRVSVRRSHRAPAELPSAGVQAGRHRAVLDEAV